MDALTASLGLLYLVIAAITWERARRVGAHVLLRLVPFQLVVGTMASIVVLEDVGLDGLVMPVFMLALTAYPVALLRFVAALVPTSTRLGSRWIGRGAAVAAVTAIVAAWAETEVVMLVVALALALAACGAHVVAFVVIRRQAEGLRSAFVRRRAHALNSGLSVLGVAFAASLFLQPPDWVAPVMGLMSAVLLIAFTVPPRWLQAVFLQPDLDALADAEQALATEEDTTVATTAILEALRSLVAARYVWLDRAGVPRLGAGHPPEDGAPAAPADLEPWTVSAIPTMLDDSTVAHWIVHLRTADGVIGVITAADPAMYGLDRGQLLPRLGRRISFALDARQLAAARSARDHAAQEADHFRRLAELKDDLLSTMNHELRTPLVSVTGALELVAGRWDGIEDEQRRLLVERALHNARTLQQVLLDVLALAALRAGSASVDTRSTTVERLLEVATASLPANGRLTLDASAATVELDLEHAARMVRHLVNNGLMHTDGPVSVSAHVVDERLHVVVVDHGPGLPSELFEPFSRAGHYLTRSARGLGLGLSLVEETAELVAAEVVVRSNVTAPGTCIELVLPVGPVRVETGAMESGAMETVATD